MLGYITGVSIDGTRGDLQAYGKFPSYNAPTNFGSVVGQYSWSDAAGGYEPGDNVVFTLDAGLSVNSISRTGTKTTPSTGRDF